jgi:hypothetical protein
MIHSGRVPTAPEIVAYNTAAAELQDMARELLRRSGFREEWGVLADTAPQDRLGVKMHAQLREQLPPRPRGPWE